MSVLLQKPGILTTVQDLGRCGFARFGINPGGVMDRAATRLLNVILGNDDSAAVLEMYYPAAEIVFETEAVIAIGGADFAPTLDGAPLENWRSVAVKQGSTLRFPQKRSGNIAYLAIRGGFSVDEWLLSYSTNLAANIGGFHGRKLQTGDRIEINITTQAWKSCHLAPSLIPLYDASPIVRITRGAEFEHLTDSGRDQLLSGNFIVSTNSNRMGFRLSGDPIAIGGPAEITSSAVTFGTIQLLPDGQLVVLMADHQTSGGYPRIAQVISRDLPLLARLGPNNTIRFRLIQVDEAEHLAHEFETELNFLRIAVGQNKLVGRVKS